MKKRRWTILLLVTFIITILSGCAKSQATIKDRSGIDVTLPKSINKIISTAPSNTEVLTALGLGDKIIAVDKYSKGIEGLRTDITTIDFRNPDAETILKLQPDIIIASGHNKSGEEDPFKLIKEAAISVVYIPSSDSIQGIYDDINFMANITGTDKKGKEIIDNMKSEIDKIKKIGETITAKKTVYFEIAAAPNIYTFGKGTFLHEMIEIIGATNVFADQGIWIQVSGEAVLKSNPDVIMTNVNYVENPVEEIKSRDGWNSLEAVTGNQVYSIDSNSSLHSSQNIIKALKEMAKAVYPDKYE